MQDTAETHTVERSLTTRRRLELAIVVGASLVVSTIFCNKAFHIDDTLYLSIARQIQLDPIRPFDGLINWEHVARPAWDVSISPPGYSYWLAGWMKLGVTSEVGLHLAGSFWVILLGVATYEWARRLGPWALGAALIVVTGPAIMAGQNLMLDVPMLALAATSIVLYLRSTERQSAAWAALAGVVAGLAINVKYAGIVTIVVMGLDAILSRQWRLLAAPAIGLIILLAGQVASYLVYDTAQLTRAREWITRLFPTDLFDALHRTSMSATYLGALAAWLPLWVGSLFRRSFKAVLLWALAVTGTVAAIADFRVSQPEALSPTVTVAILHVAFFAFSGWLAIGGLITKSLCAVTQTAPTQWAGARMRPQVPSAGRHAILVVVWTAGFWYLGALNSPFVAPRAILPCLLGCALATVASSAAQPLKLSIPQSLQFAANAPPRKACWAAVAFTALVGLLVGAADYQWAGLYRQSAPGIAVAHKPRDGTVWFLGHWGWQYYAEASGMLAYDPLRTQLRSGDLLIIPSNVYAHPIPRDAFARLRPIATEEISGSRWLPRTRDLNGFIFFYGDTERGRIPWGWSLSTSPLERFLVLQVVD